MRITVITGSPRKHGNSFAMTETFIKEAEHCGHEIKRFDAAFMKIGGCHACMTCYKTMPVYWYSIPAQIKGVIDCMFSLVVGGKEVAGKKWGLITCCEEDDPTVMDGVRISMERTAALLKWELAGEVLIPGVLNEGEIKNTDGCKQAAELAYKF